MGTGQNRESQPHTRHLPVKFVSTERLCRDQERYFEPKDGTVCAAGTTALHGQPGNLQGEKGERRTRSGTDAQ